MSQELIYTSVPKGLKPGSRGFSTVAMTSGLSSSWVDRLESLSAYQPIYPLGDPQESRNPVNYCHWRVTVAGKTRSVLSRIAFAGADYSQRSNKFAHHIVLDPAEQAAAGPAWMMRQRGLFKSDWTGEPTTLPNGPSIPSGDRPAAICSAWAAVSGDAGWAGVLAESFLSNPTKPAYVIFEPGMDVLTLFEEAIALLPAKKRWEVSFNTYFTELPLSLNCAWRAVAAGTKGAVDAQRSGGRPVVIDLTKSIAVLPESSELVEAGRTGKAKDRKSTLTDFTKPLLLIPNDDSGVDLSETSASAKPATMAHLQTAGPSKLTRRRLNTANPLQAESKEIGVAGWEMPEPTMPTSQPVFTQKRRSWAIPTAIFVMIVLLAGVAAVLLRHERLQAAARPPIEQKLLLPPDLHYLDENHQNSANNKIGQAKSNLNTISVPSTEPAANKSAASSQPGSHEVSGELRNPASTTSAISAVDPSKVVPSSRPQEAASRPTTGTDSDLVAQKSISVPSSLLAEAVNSEPTVVSKYDLGAADRNGDIDLGSITPFDAVAIIWPNGQTDGQPMLSPSIHGGTLFLSQRYSDNSHLNLDVFGSDAYGGATQHMFALHWEPSGELKITWHESFPKDLSSLQEILRYSAFVLYKNGADHPTKFALKSSEPDARVNLESRHGITMPPSLSPTLRLGAPQEVNGWTVVSEKTGLSQQFKRNSSSFAFTISLKPTLPSGYDFEVVWPPDPKSDQLIAANTWKNNLQVFWTAVKQHDSPKEPFVGGGGGDASKAAVHLLGDIRQYRDVCNQVKSPTVSQQQQISDKSREIEGEFSSFGQIISGLRSSMQDRIPPDFRVSLRLPNAVEMYGLQVDAASPNGGKKN